LDRPSPQGVPELGVWNGKEFVVTVESGDSWWETAKLLWRYGLAPIKTNRLMKSTVGKFLTLYDEPTFPWKSLSEVVQAVDLTQTTGVTGQQFLKSNGIGDKFAAEIIQASTRVNYASNLGLIHGLETMVCMATNGAMAVEGGNWQIFSSMLNSSTSITTHLKTPITHVSKQPDGTYILQTGNGKPQSFDTVVLASPLQFSNLVIDPAPEHVPDQIPYVGLHVTLFASPYELDPAAFNLSPGEKVPQFVLTTLPDGEDHGSDPHGVGTPGFFSISIVSEAQNPNSDPPGRTEWIYKIFSAEEVDAEFLSRILGHTVKLEGSIEDTEEGGSLIMAGNNAVTWVHKKLWHSYPYEFPRVTFEELKLDDGLWYTSGIESFISTMETSALMGKNVARLISDQWAEGTKSGKVGEESLRVQKEDTWEFEGVGEGEQKPLKAKL
jgi:prenylcysteine oxidase/farnesylcysteine lyase